MNHTEIEFKWEANSPRAFERVKRALARGGVRVGAWKTYFITDVYVDTPAQDFEKQKIAFRVRHVHPCWQATFKTRTEIRNGKAVRREETLPLRGVENLAQALEKLHRKKIWQGLNMQNLRPLFTLKNKRRALENLRKKLTEMRISEEEERIKREKREQLDDKRRKISIDLRKNTFFDHRLEKEYPFPLSQSDAESYMESLYLR